MPEEARERLLLVSKCLEQSKMIIFKIVNLVNR